jgi:hypothetical protein
LLLSRRHAEISVLFPTKCHFTHYLISFGSHNIKVFCKPCEKFKRLAEKNVVREGGLWVFKYGRQNVKVRLLLLVAVLVRCSVFLLRQMGSLTCGLVQCRKLIYFNNTDFFQNVFNTWVSGILVGFQHVPGGK